MHAKLEKINEIEVVSLRQKQALGLGHAIYCAKNLVGKEPFAVLLPDELMLGPPNITQQLWADYTKTQASSVAIMSVPPKQVSRYGIAGVQPVNNQEEETQPTAHNDFYRVTEVVEKPSLDKAPSRWALCGRYVLSPTIFEFLEKSKPGALGEIQLTDSIQKLLSQETVYARSIECRRFDVGQPLGFLMANVHLGVENKEISDEFKLFLQQELGKTKYVKLLSKMGVYSRAVVVWFFVLCLCSQWALHYKKNCGKPWTWRLSHALKSHGCGTWRCVLRFTTRYGVLGNRRPWTCLCGSQEPK